MANLQSAFGIFALPRPCLDRQRRPPRRGVEAGRGRAAGDVRYRGHPAQGPGRHARVRGDQRCGRCDRRRKQGRHLLRFWLSRWRPTSLRAQGAGGGICARAAGLADRAGDERVDHALVPLAHPAAARARLLLAAGAHAQGRRGGRALDRGQYLSRHGRGAAVHPALPGEPHAQRAVHRDDRRHGWHRRHGFGDLRHFARPAHPRRRGAFRDRWAFLGRRRRRPAA